jgi:hypothetical protein
MLLMPLMEVLLAQLKLHKLSPSPKLITVAKPLMQMDLQYQETQVEILFRLVNQPLVMEVWHALTLTQGQLQSLKLMELIPSITLMALMYLRMLVELQQKLVLYLIPSTEARNVQLRRLKQLP